MVLSSGGPNIHGAWFFTENAPYSGEHTFGSLNYYKGNTEAIFSGVGEVSRGVWRDGSPLPCTPPMPCLPCFSAELSGYTFVKMTLNAGGEENATHVTGDTWTHDFPAQPNYTFQTSCGTRTPGCQDLKITGPHGTGSAHAWCESTSIDHSTHTYEWLVPPGIVPGWPGFKVTARIGSFTPPNIISGANALTHNNSSSTANWSLSWTGTAGVILTVFQYGTDNGGGSLTDPPTPSGFTKILTTASHRMTVFVKLGVPFTTSITVPLNANADIQFFTAIAIGGSFSGTLDAHATLEGQTAVATPSITLGSPPTTPCIEVANFNAHRTAATSSTTLVYSYLNAWDASTSPSVQTVVGATPLFETLAYNSGASALSSGGFTAPSWHTAGTPRQWDAMAFYIH